MAGQIHLLDGESSEGHPAMDHQKKLRKLYLAVTLDRYELPTAVADSADELSRMTGKSVNTIHSSISHVKHGYYKRSQYVAVEVEDWEDDDDIV